MKIYFSILVLLLLPLYVNGETANNPKNFEIFGVEFNTAETRLLNEIEIFYGQKVDWKEDSGTSFNGYSDLTDDGIPLVRIHPVNGRTKSTIIHELLHLKLWSEGWPKVSIQPDSVAKAFPNMFGNASNLSDALGWYRQRFYNNLEHQEIYRRLKIMHIDLNLNWTKEVETTIKQQDQIQWDSSYKISFYFKNSLDFATTKQTDLMRSVDEMYLAKHWNREREIALKMAGIFNAKKLSKYNIVKTSIDCLNLLDPDLLKFEAKELKREKFGKVQLNTLNIEMKLLRRF